MTAVQQTEYMSLGWLDNSQAEQDRIKTMLSLLQEKGALDEIGIGTIRDAFANLLFPGITTIQTRAKYLVLLLYLFQEADKEARKAAEKKVSLSTQKLVRFIYDSQDRLVDIFKANQLKTGVKERGVIGIRTRDVVQKPTFIYWGALTTFQMVNPNLSLYQMCNVICQNAVAAEQKRNPSVKEIKDVDDYFEDAPDASLDVPALYSPITWDNSNWREGLSMNLTYDEAEFICNKILTSPKSQNSAFTQLLCYYRDRNETFRSLNLDTIPATALDTNMKNIFQLAKAFRDFIFGAYLAYNYLLSNRTDAVVKEVYDLWKKQDFNNVPLEDILRVSKAKWHQREFLRKLLNYANAGEWRKYEDCIQQREQELKLNRKKIGTYDPENNPYESPFKQSEDVYTMLLDFRANNAGKILKDILKGLIKGDAK
ncbi:MAG: hypothetical protein IKX40_13755 [Thermoguttaceae bacterium]|nr:hypothetical protein [Thermoguttaceae bacterium]